MTKRIDDLEALLVELASADRFDLIMASLTGEVYSVFVNERRAALFYMPDWAEPWSHFLGTGEVDDGRMETFFDSFGPCELL